MQSGNKPDSSLVWALHPLQREPRGALPVAMGVILYAINLGVIGLFGNLIIVIRYRIKKKRMSYPGLTPSLTPGPSPNGSTHLERGERPNRGLFRGTIEEQLFLPHVWAFLQSSPAPLRTHSGHRWCPWESAKDRRAGIPFPSKVP